MVRVTTISFLGGVGGGMKIGRRLHVRIIYLPIKYTKTHRTAAYSVRSIRTTFLIHQIELHYIFVYLLALTNGIKVCQLAYK